MLSGRTIAIAISSALLALSQVNAAAAATPLTTKRVASRLTKPLYVTHAPEDFDRIFIVQQTGEILILELQTEKLLGTPYLDLSTTVSCCIEQGLLALAFHPDYASNGYFFVYYTNASGDTVVERYSVSGDPETSNVADAQSAYPILVISQPALNHNGGWLGFGPNDAYLYITTGDGGFLCDPDQRAQDITNEMLGKILRIDVDSGSPYAIPSGNPFVNRPGDGEIWAYGLRNPFRSAFDSETGDFYIADVGASHVEEVNIQLASSSGGENYGWDCMEGDQCSTVSGCETSWLYVQRTRAHTARLSVHTLGGYSHHRWRGLPRLRDLRSGRIVLLRRFWEQPHLEFRVRHNRTEPDGANLGAGPEKRQGHRDDLLIWP